MRYPNNIFMCSIYTNELGDTFILVNVPKHAVAFELGIPYNNYVWYSTDLSGSYFHISRAIPCEHIIPNSKRPYKVLGLLSKLNREELGLGDNLITDEPTNNSDILIIKKY